MNDGYVKSEVNGGIASIIFHHPKSNSLPAHVLQGLAKAIEEAGKNKDVRVIVMRSDGDKAFCAGASFDELVAIDTVEQGKVFFSGFALVINAIRKAPCLVIGRIHGKAVGGGVGLASACDVSYAHESAAVRLSELAVGIGPFVVGPAVERKVGNACFGLLSITPATWRSAAWAQEKGLYAETFGSLESLDNAVHAHATELSKYSPEAMAELKKVMWQGTGDWDVLLHERAAISGRLVVSQFTRAAIAKFKAEAAKR